MNLNKLYTIIKARQQSMPRGSYVAALFAGSFDRIIQKVGEEAAEVLIAAKNTDRRRQIEEISDLLFHILILLVSLNIPLIEVLKELEGRHNTKK